MTRVSKFFNRFSPKAKMITGFGLAFIVLIAAAVFSFASFSKINDTIDKVATPTNKVIKLEEISTDIYDAESGVRAFLLTNDEAHLDRLNNVVNTIEGKLDDLYMLYRTDPEQLDRLEILQALIKEKLQILYEYVELEQQYKVKQNLEDIIADVQKMENQDSMSTSNSADSEAEEISSEGDISLKERISRLFRKRAEEQEASARDGDQGASPEANGEEIIQSLRNVIDQIEPDTTEPYYQHLVENISTDGVVMAEINAVIEEIKAEEQGDRTARAQTSVNTIFNNLTNIFLFGFISFLVAGILIYLVLMDFAKSRQQREEAVLERRVALQTSKIKEDFLHTVSHEIRTPLSSIKLYSDILLENETDSAKQKQLKIIQSSSNHIITIINDLLDFAKMQSGKISLEEVRFEIADLVEEVVGVLEPEAQKKEIYLKAYVDAELPLVKGDPVRLKQILLNLVKNSVKFTENGGVTIKASVGSSDGGMIQVLFEVEDTGIGIPPEKLATIFEEYAQADESTTRKYGGTGLGLSISKKLVEVQQGVINVKSEVGHGSQFSFTIPYKTAGAE